MVKMARSKPRNLLASALHRLKPLLPLNFLLDVSAITHRLAFEKAPVWADVSFIQKHIRSNDRVVELGCSSGRVLSQIRAGERVGVDRDGQAINEGRRLHPDITFIHGSECPPGFDVLILSHVLEHLDEPEAVLSLAERIYVEVPDFDSDPLNHVRLERGTIVHTDADHVAEWSRDEIESLFRKCGLEMFDSEFRHGVMRYWLRR